MLGCVCVCSFGACENGSRYFSQKEEMPKILFFFFPFRSREARSKHQVSVPGRSRRGRTQRETLVTHTQTWAISRLPRLQPQEAFPHFCKPKFWCEKKSGPPLVISSPKNNKMEGGGVLRVRRTPVSWGVPVFSLTFTHVPSEGSAAEETPRQAHPPCDLRSQWREAAALFSRSFPKKMAETSSHVAGRCWLMQISYFLCGASAPRPACSTTKQSRRA
jgi:hypothetical protein